MWKACLNGARRRDEHPAVPLTPAELAADAVRCATLGVAAVHVHPRDADGAESLSPAVIAEAVTAIRAARPGLSVGVSTGAWIAPDPADRVAAVRAWSVLPDFASVNAHEDGAEAVAAALHERGVLVEAGLWTVDAVRAWRGWRVPAGRVLVECLADEPDRALADAADMLALLTPGDPPVLLHGEGRATWPVLFEAVRRGLDTRIGLEDTLYLPDGAPAPDNAALAGCARALGAR
ncbi:3-keto-5-aminohexanoate cleavage protein [Micromonospora sp. HUAS LYJ1]|uniref:3-keto-5-aminohexanoate cleavage protein n=1 Tax=Micromonospora sp. HUAS LYJ1 TaxID=3061626 RepID=UPI002672A977|nr:3-keto-5-aminohexanoate cleavage protein [Micromonospora sp. HUAS LYJ1]WKU04772.1 3-keto-5-aminohexanoate cleavage protein [Micromonospora sp. HUAS LYJ1]